MTDFFLDPVGGNDGNDGLSFANRWKTVTSGATAARIAPGDRIKIIKSPDATSLGQTATWTNKSATLTLTSAVTLNVTTCESAWTASANVTCTTSTTRREGSNSASIAVAGAFTTGKAAYFSISSTDYSAYQQLSFSIQTGTAIVANAIRICLCSDTTGDTPVDQFTISHNLAASRWYGLAIDKGSALGSAIQSVAIYVDSDLGASQVTLLLDNIFAAKAVSDADSLTLRSVVSKDFTSATEGIYIIRSINGTTVILDQDINGSASSTPRGYSGTTGSATVYKRECYLFPPASSPVTACIVQDSGSQSGGVITFSGGWDTTNMSTQTGETWFDGVTAGASVWSTNGNTFIALEHMGIVRGDTGLTVSGGNSSIHNISVVGCGSSCAALSGDRLSITGWLKLSSCNSTAGTISGATTYQTGNITATSNGGVIAINSSGRFGTIIANNSSSSGMSCQAVGPQVINSLTAKDNGVYGLLLSTGSWLTLNSLTTSGNTTGSTNASNLSSNSLVRIRSSSIGEATILNNAITAGSGSQVIFQNLNGVSGTHRTYVDGGTIDSVSDSNRHTLTGLAWSITPSSTNRNTVYPIKLLAGRIAVNSGSQVTVTAWVKRSHATNIGARLVVYGGSIAGVSSDVTATASAAADTYEQLTLNFTPTESGVVDIWFEGYTTNTTTGAIAYIDDFNASQ